MPSGDWRLHRLPHAHEPLEAGDCSLWALRGPPQAPALFLQHRNFFLFAF